MIEENSIFLAGGDALVDLGESMHKKYSTKIFWSNPRSTSYLMTDFSTPFLLYTPVHIFDDLPSISQVAYVLNGWPISQPKNK